MVGPPIPVPDDLGDELVRIRPFAPRDVDAVVTAVNDPDTVRWTRVPQPYSAETARGWFATHEEERRTGSGASFAGVDPVTDELLCSIGFVATDWEQRTAEIGYWVVPEARGRGVASRATRLLAEWGIRKLGLERVELLADPRNLASCRAAEKAGFTREGLLRQARFAPRSRTDRSDLVMFSLLPEDL